MGEGFEFSLRVSAIEISEKLRLSGEFYNGKLHRGMSRFLLFLAGAFI
jgi:hypothetical protein